MTSVPTDMDRGKTNHILTVSELTAKIKFILEEKFPIAWICGEISNLRIPSSGHLYFTLKDQNAQIQAVMFRNQARNVKFEPEEGVSVVVIGRISVYEPRGNYQIIAEHMDPKGIGALQLAFEKLKAKLHEEGIFDAEHKKPIPYLPRTICLITSPTGAVVHDMLNIISRRYPGMHIEIIPVRVQGDEAVAEIAQAIEWANRRGKADVIAVARGGGSLEDLWAFNTELVAQAIYNSLIPVVAAVGHETDYTIADFTADLRAPTPSAAAELLVPIKIDLKQNVVRLEAQVNARFQDYLQRHRQILNALNSRIVHPRRKIEDMRLKLDDMNERIFRGFQLRIERKKERLAWRMERMKFLSPIKRIEQARDRLRRMTNELHDSIVFALSRGRSQIGFLEARLCALNPEAILQRGYSITRRMPSGAVVKDPEPLLIGDKLEVRVALGTMQCRLEGKTVYDKKENI